MNINKIECGYCNPVLPLVYDKSLSYYEQLCKQNAKINELINFINNSSISPSPTNNQVDKWLMIGDSYGNGVTVGRDSGKGWCDYLREKLVLSDENYFKYVENSSGFTKLGVGGHTFNSLLNLAYNEISDSDSITKIIVCGGWNDADSNSTTLNGAIASFIDNAHIFFKNATVYVGMIANNSEYSNGGASFRETLFSNVLRCYQNSCVYGNAIYLTGVEWVLKYYPFMSTDYTHPNDFGYQFLSGYIYNAIFNGAQFNQYYENMQINLSSGSLSGTINTSIIGGMVTVMLSNIAIDFSTPISIQEDWYQLGTYVANHMRPTYDLQVLVNFYLYSDGFFGGQGILQFTRDGRLLFSPALLKNDGQGFIRFNNVNNIHIYNTTEALPANIC